MTRVLFVSWLPTNAGIKQDRYNHYSSVVKVNKYTKL